MRVLGPLLLPLTLVLSWSVVLRGVVAGHEVLGGALTGLAGIALVSFLGALRPNWGVYARPTGRGPDGDAVALTFDDGPHPDHTPRILDILARAGARATFFVVGERVLAHPEVVRRIVAEGHQLGSHSHRHDWRLAFTHGGLLRDLRRSDAALVEVTGHSPRLFRPPVGLVSPELFDAARKLGYRVLTWSVRAYDGRAAATSQGLIRRVVSKIRGGDIVLLHDGAVAGGSPRSIEALPELLRHLDQVGLRAVTVAELLGEPAHRGPEAVPQPGEVSVRRSPYPLTVLATLILLTTLFVRGALAAPSVPPELAAAAAELTAHETVQGRFVQTKSSALLVQDDVRTGRLLVRQADRRIVWSYDGGKSFLVADGRFFPAGDAPVDAQARAGYSMPGGDRMTQVMSGLFSLDPELIGEHFQVEALGEGRFELRPRAKDTAAIFRRVVLELGGAPLVLRAVTMDEATGDSTSLRFEDVQVDAPVPSGAFLTPAERAK